MSLLKDKVGVVVIGRNEGERLLRCLNSVLAAPTTLVNVDSGTTDGSIAAARSLSADVVELDRSRPFSAARARNAGLARLLELKPDIQYVQFVDGDCEVMPTWLNTACEELDRRLDLAVICGRLRERFPEASVFNRLCDLEWNSGTGQIRASGGICMIKVKPFLEVGQFNTVLIAGEEGELCLRLREAGWKVIRLDAPMALHDAAMTSFGQWWKRSIRAGHAYAQNAALRVRGPEKHDLRQLFSAAVWGCAVPICGILSAIMAIWFPPAFAILAMTILLEILLVFRVSRGRIKMGDSAVCAFQYGLFIVPAKVAHCLGAAKFWYRVALGRQIELIEHKTSPAAGSIRIRA